MTKSILKEPETSSNNNNAETNADLMNSDEESARLLQAEEEALYVSSQDTLGMERRLLPYIDQVLMYEDPIRQEAARKTVPVHELEEKASVSLAKEGNFGSTKSERDHIFLLQLLFWFIHSFRRSDRLYTFH